MVSDYFETTPESTEIKLVSPSEIPWHSIAFKVMEQSLRNYLKEQETGTESLFNETLVI